MGILSPLFRPSWLDSQGRTEKQALKNIKEAIELHVHTLAEDGLPLNGNKDAKETLVSVAL